MELSLVVLSERKSRERCETPTLKIKRGGTRGREREKSQEREKRERFERRGCEERKTRERTQKRTQKTCTKEGSAI